MQHDFVERIAPFPITINLVLKFETRFDFGFFSKKSCFMQLFESINLRR
jgi:hypothetical protein